MKIKCDVCSSELIMNMDCSGAVCSLCGVTYSIERLREMLAANKEDTEKNETPEPVIEEAEELPYIFFCAEQQDMDEKESGVGALLRVEYDIYTDGTMEIVYDYDEGENYCQNIIGKERFEKDLMFKLTEEEFETFTELLGNTDALEPDELEGGMKWSFEIYSENGDTVNKKEGSVDNSPELTELTSFLVSKHKWLKGVRDLYVFARASAETKYKRLYKYLEMDPAILEKISAATIIDEVLADITEREIPNLQEKLHRIDKGEDFSIIFSEDKKEEAVNVPIDDVTDGDRHIFTATLHNGSANFQDSDYWSYTEYEIYKDKRCAVRYKYNKSGLSEPVWKNINDSDYKELESAISEIDKAQPFRIPDCDFWKFHHYHNGSAISKITSDEGDPYAKKIIDILKRLR
ncbi:MAG: hypothetical protein J6M16_04980 [Clostridia bacterium]|nr:hypothetical protein [Clostridia bacterium]